MREELTRRQDSQSRALSSISTLSGLLVGASALSATLITAGSTAVTGWLAAGAAFSLLAAAFGVASVFPRTANEIRPLRIREQLLSQDRVTGSLWLNDRIIELIMKRTRAIQHRFALVRIGLLSLGASIVCVLAPVAIELMGRR